MGQAVKRTAPRLQNRQIWHEQKLIAQLLTHMANDSGLYVVGLRDTLQLLADGAVKTLLVTADNDFVTARAQRIDAGEQPTHSRLVLLPLRVAHRHTDGNVLEERVRHAERARIREAAAALETEVIATEKKGWEVSGSERECKRCPERARGRRLRRRWTQYHSMSGWCQLPTRYPPRLSSSRRRRPRPRSSAAGSEASLVNRASRSNWLAHGPLPWGLPQAFCATPST